MQLRLKCKIRRSLKQVKLGLINYSYQLSWQKKQHPFMWCIIISHATYIVKHHNTIYCAYLCLYRLCNRNQHTYIYIYIYIYYHIHIYYHIYIYILPWQFQLRLTTLIIVWLNYVILEAMTLLLFSMSRKMHVLLHHFCSFCKICTFMKQNYMYHFMARHVIKKVKTIL